MSPDEDSARVLVFAPVGRDGPASADLLRRIGLSAEACAGLRELVENIEAGAAAVFVAEEGLYGKDISSLTNWIERQPPWSDLPFVVLTSQQTHQAVTAWRQRLTGSLRNVSFLERPVQAITLTSTMQAALRARTRQYEVRTLLEGRERAAQELEALVTARTSELNATNDELRRQMAERMHAEEALRQSQKMEAVGQLTGGLAHDFNNLLAGISGSLELLQTRISQGRVNDLGRYIIAAQGAATRAAAITHRLLAFSRRQTLDPKPIDANRLIVSMEELIRRTAGPAITVETVLAAGLWPVLCDPNQLENVLLNLCINAHDAMPDGGSLTIETANTWVDERAADARDMTPGHYVALRVSDTGTGMTPEVAARAFDPFFTTKPIGMGTGLGLSMIHGFTRQSGGQVRIDSQVGEGTSMRLYLPRYQGKVEGEELFPDLAEAPRAEAGETVLIVDDESTVRMLVTEVLEDLGYTAIEAADGLAGLHVLQSDARIDLLISDVGLPGGMNGRQVADAARELRPELKVLFITGYAENAALSHGHLEPGMHVLTKPFALEALASRIRELISKA